MENSGQPSRRPGKYRTGYGKHPSLPNNNNARPSQHQHRRSLWRRIDLGDLARTLFVGACAIAVASGITWPWPQVPVLAVAGLIMGCWPILTEAIEDAKERKMSMELSMLIAIVAAAAIGELTTSLVITTFVLAAEILEDLSMDRGRDTLTDLMAFLPNTVHVKRNGETVGTNSSYGHIIEAVKQAQFSEPPVQRLADRLAAYLIYLTLIGAVITYIVTRDLTSTISVVVVAGACGIVACTPLAALAPIARIALNGAFVKDGAHLEEFPTVNTIYLQQDWRADGGGTPSSSTLKQPITAVRNLYWYWTRSFIHVGSETVLILNAAQLVPGLSGR